MRFRVYVAATVDGFIADASGGVTFLDGYDPTAYGYEAFVASVSTVIAGRATYEQALGFGGVPWAGKRAIVLTSRELPGIETARDVAALAASLRAEDAGDAWIMGGARTVRTFLEAGAVDELDLYIIPTLLGDGIRLFLPTGARTPLVLVEASTHPRGVARLLYRRST